MNILSDFEIRINNMLSGDSGLEITRLSKLLKEKEELIIQYANELNKSGITKKPARKKAGNTSKLQSTAATIPAKKKNIKKTPVKKVPLPGKSESLKGATKKSEKNK
jgi:hypothetical protein